MAHRINAIWIDQECIDQNDPLDKENSIQEMDMVYQESDHPIAVIGFEFTTQAEADAFSSICDDAYFSFDPSQIEILEEILLVLCEVEWFERAWTLQESVSAGLSMTLLFGCPGLRKSSHFGPTPGVFEISIWNFQHAMVSVRNLVEEGLAAGVWPNSRSAVQVSNCADVLWNYLPTISPNYIAGTPYPLKRDSSHRQVCNASQALNYLNPRLNSVFPDRLAILANLCNYDYRINTKVFDLPGRSFTVCVHTLAILNGDMSLLGGYSDKDLKLTDKSAWFMGLAEDARSYGKLVYPNDDTDLQLNAYGFSWGPKPYACLKKLIYLEENGNLFRLTPATLSVQGLRVRGVIWDVDSTVPVPRTQSAFAWRWQEELGFLRLESQFSEGMSRQQPLVREFFWSLLHEIYSSGLLDLARTLWNLVQPVGRDPISNLDSIEVPLPYSFDMVFGQQHRNYDKEKEIESQLSIPHLWFDPESMGVDRPRLERLLIEQVCRDGALLCATPVDPLGNTISSTLPQPHVWFEACKLGDKFFTPVTDLGDRAARSPYRNEAMSWRVLDTGKSGDDGCKVLRCLGRRRGIWRIDELSHQDYILD
ncbi:MAG: hypothetical protein Q9201_006956 [Fulgogasparrea decipioides]